MIMGPTFPLQTPTLTRISRTQGLSLNKFWTSWLATFVARTEEKQRLAQKTTPPPPSPIMSAIRGRLPDRSSAPATLDDEVQPVMAGAYNVENARRTLSPDPLVLDVVVEEADDRSLLDMKGCGYCNGAPGGSRYCDCWIDKDKAFVEKRI